MKIAILITSYNRRDHTLACLENLGNQKINNNVKLEIYLTDDISTDGTAKAVKQQFPHVQICEGTGSFFGPVECANRGSVPYLPILIFTYC